MEKNNLTSEQLAWISEVLASRPCFLSARAGTGKTTTICEAVRARASAGLPLPAVIAFNKRIAEELRLKLPQGTQVQTLHSLGFASLRTFAPHLTVDQSKTFELLSAKHLRNTALKPRRWKDTYALIGLLKAAGFIPLEVPSLFRSKSLLDPEALPSFTISHQLFDADLEISVEVLRESLQAFLTSQSIDFSDMLYLPYALGLSPNLPALTLIDEAQDLSALDLSFLSRSRSALFPVGDPFQSIYGWRGAVPDILKRLKLPEFPLTYSFRCAKRVASCAATLVPDFKSARSEQGSVDYLNEVPEFLDLPASCVIARTNADLISLALPLLQRNVPVCFLGKSYADDLVELLKSFKSSGFAALHSELSEWLKLMSEKYPQLTHEFKNKAKIILSLLDLYPNKPALLTVLPTLFCDTPRPGAWIFSTVHAAKGLEFPSVYLASWEQKPYDSDEEHRNLLYVAMTRAKDALKIFPLEDAEGSSPGPESRPQSRDSSTFSDPFLF